MASGRRPRVTGMSSRPWIGLPVQRWCKPALSWLVQQMMAILPASVLHACVTLPMHRINVIPCAFLPISSMAGT
eukprot:4446127-Lingulodinium_polyedra.AAC.1